MIYSAVGLREINRDCTEIGIHIQSRKNVTQKDIQYIIGAPVHLKTGLVPLKNTICRGPGLQPIANDFFQNSAETARDGNWAVTRGKPSIFVLFINRIY